MRRNVTADMIRQAILRRHLEQLEQAQAAGATPGVVNNVYGGGGAADAGMRGQMMPDAEDGDYMVDITRTPEEDGGWTKKVHRYRAPKGGDANPPAKAGGKKKAHRYRPE